MLNKKELEMRTIEPLRSLSGTHALIFNNIKSLSRLALFNSVNCEKTILFTGQMLDR